MERRRRRVENGYQECMVEEMERRRRRRVENGYQECMVGEMERRRRRRKVENGYQ